MDKTKLLKNLPNYHPGKSFIKRIFNLPNLNKILLISIVVLGIFYIAGTNDLAIKGYTLSDLKEQSSKLADENKKLELQAMDLSSYILSVRRLIIKNGSSGNIDYINGTIETMAKK